MNKNRIIIIAILTLFTLFIIVPASGFGLFPAGDSTLLEPQAGTLYHSAFAPVAWSSVEGPVTEESIASYEDTIGKTVVWAIFSDMWYQDPSFPGQQAKMIRDAGSVPYIRLIIGSADRNEKETLVALGKINAGDLDDSIRLWVRNACEFVSPLIVEVSTEINGLYPSWDGYEGGGTKGSEAFKDAYIRIINIADEEGADNIIWVYHLDAVSIPDEFWNQFALYYPGDDYIDWIGVSVYGALTPMDEDISSFSFIMDQVYPRLISISPDKPIIISEFGTTNNNPLSNQSLWAEDALSNLTEYRWPKVIGFSWWNEQWKNDEDELHDTDMRVQDNPTLAKIFKKYVASNNYVLGTPEILGEDSSEKETLDYSPEIIMAEELDSPV
jgi:hypothetical protein